MTCNIQTLSHEPLIWKDDFPPGFAGLHLPGGTILSASGEFGHLCVQEYSTESFCLRYNEFRFDQPFILQADIADAALFSQLVLNGKAQQYISDALQWPLSKNQFVLVDHASLQMDASYSPQSAFSSIETLFSEQWLMEMKELFPGYKIGMAFPRWADANTLDQVYTILRCPFDKNLRHHFFDSRVRELLYFFLRQQSVSPGITKQPSEKELIAVHSAASIITADISKHVEIKELSKKVNLNENRLKAVFRIVFGVGPYKFLVKLRMQQALDLLKSGLSVKETAAKTGYRPTDLTGRFIKYYGFPPSAVKKMDG
ncbi:MAG: AraC family transcriptional regulator [Chitinophagaceae bacterium]